MTALDWLVSGKKCPMCGNTERIHAISISSWKGDHYWEDTKIYLRCGICFFESDHWRKNRSWKKKLNRRWNMSDLISREEVLESLKTDYSLIMFDSYGNLTFAGERIIEAIKGVPSVEPERKKGKWEYIQYDGNPKIGNWHCSNCRLIVNLGFEGVPYYHYCPGCGAKMEVQNGKENS